MTGTVHRHRRVLAVAYCFPPQANSGAIRNLKLFKHLPACGWRLRVLTVRPGADRADNRLTEQISGEIEVIRTRCFYTHRFLAGLKKLVLLRWLRRSRNTDPQQQRADAGTTSRPPRESEAWRPRRLKGFIENLLSIPDKYVGWLPFAVLAGIRSLRAEPADVIYAVGKPWTSFFVGYLLKRLFGKPLVIDFMDPWRASTWAPSKGRLLDKVQTLLESFIVRRADFVIANTPELAQDFAQRLNVPADRIGVITCGYDQDDFGAQVPGRGSENGRFTVTHTGTFYKRRDPTSFLRAVKVLLDRQVIPHDDLRINFVGRMGIRDPALLELLADPSLSTVLNHESWVPHSKAVEYLRSSDLLLLVQPDTRLQIPAKLYEYACTRKPVLALCQKGGAVDNIMRRESWGPSVENANVQEIAHALEDLYKEHKNGNRDRRVSSGTLEKYSVKFLAGKLASIFDQVISGHRGRRNSGKPIAS